MTIDRRTSLALIARWSGLAASVLALAAALPAGAQAADGELVIGFAGPVTGSFAELGGAMKNGAEYAVNEINAAGGLKVGSKTYTLKLAVGDTEGAVAERAVAASRRLAEVDKAHGIVGYAISTNFLAAMPLLQQAKVPTLDTSGRAASIPEKIAADKMDYMFQVSPTNADFVPQHGALLAKLIKPKKVAFLLFNTDVSRDYYDRAAKDWPTQMPGLETRAFFVEPSKMDLQAELLQVRSYAPEVLYVILAGQQNYAFLDQFTAAGLGNRMVIFGDSVYASQGFRDRTGAKSDNSLANVQTVRAPITPISLPFYDGYKAKYGTFPPYYAVQTYDGALMLIEGIRRAGAVTGDLAADRKAIRDAMATITKDKPTVGARGDLYFSPLSEGHIVPAGLAVVQYQAGGKEAILWPEAAASGSFVDPRR